MVTFDDVARIALALPRTEETTSYGYTAWAVSPATAGSAHATGGRQAATSARKKGKVFVWERPLSAKDRRLLAESGAPDVPPDDVIMAAIVDDLSEKAAVLAEHPDIAFTTPHFDGFAAVLVRLDRLDEDLLREIVTSAWRAAAPAELTGLI